MNVKAAKALGLKIDSNMRLSRRLVHWTIEDGTEMRGEYNNHTYDGTDTIDRNAGKLLPIQQH